MCTVCGCGAGETRIDGKAVDQHGHDHHHDDGHGHGHGHHHDHGHDHAHGHSQGHSHDHAHGHSHGHSHGHGDTHRHTPEAGSAAGVRLIDVERDILSRNDAVAARNRRHFAAHQVLALNLVSSPGSGKTTLLVETLKRMKERTTVAVIEGDQETSFDADRIRSTGVRAIQVNTGKGCHLDATQIEMAYEALHIADGVLFIENVGNLVCPAGFDLGEAHKVVVCSVTEGEDKPLKYPDMFAVSSLMIVSKIDLAPHLDFDVKRLVENARRVNPGIGVLKVSSRSGEGMDQWLGWIDAARALRAAAE